MASSVASTSARPGPTPLTPTVAPPPLHLSMAKTPPLQPLSLFTPNLPQTPPPFVPSADPNLSLPDELLSPGPSASPPPTPVPSSSSNPALALLSTTSIRAISPPTPAPSPQPYSATHGRFPASRGWAASDAARDEEGREEDLVEAMRLQFFGLSARMRQRLLTALIAESPPSALSPLLPLISPRLKRDFLRTLPLELAFHVLSFVDDVRTLARASGVSRFWRALLEDEGTWKRMCWISGFGEGDAAAASSGERLRSLEFGEREEEDGTPAGRERRGTLDRSSLLEFAARAEHFGLRPQQHPPHTPNWQPLEGPPSIAPTTNWLGGRDAPAGLGFGSGFSELAQSRLPVLRRNRLAEPHPRSVPTTPHQLSHDTEPGPFHYNERAAASSSSLPPTPNAKPFSYKTHFKRAYLTESAWLRGPGRLLSTQMSADDGVVTSLGFDSDWIVVGMATSRVHVFRATTGDYFTSLDGHELGVWCLTLVSKGGGPPESTGSPAGNGNSSKWDPDPTRTPPPKVRAPTVHSEESSRRRGVHDRLFTNDSPVGGSFFRHPRDADTDSSRSTAPPRPRRRSFHSFGTAEQSSRSHSGARTGGMGLGAGGETGDSSHQASVCGTARGWGQRGAIVVTGGCDRDVRVWDVETAECLHVLRGHTSTVRCMRVLDGRPIAVSGSRDATLRVWNIQTGQAMHLLSGHEHSVRCIEVSGNKVVSGSYDATCRLWDVDTGECLYVFRGHVHQIYAVAFDGLRVVTGSLDSTVRIWSATTGQFIMLLQGHTSLVGQLQLDPVSNTLVTGGSDGRVIVFDMENYQTIHRLCAHDNSVTCLQFDDRFIVTAGNDGRIKLWDFKTGCEIRELAEPCDAVWRVTFRDDKAVILCRRDGRTLLDVRTFRPSDEELHSSSSSRMS